MEQRPRGCRDCRREDREETRGDLGRTEQVNGERAASAAADRSKSGGGVGGWMHSSTGGGSQPREGEGRAVAGGASRVTRRVCVS